MSASKLKLNPDKTEFIVFGSKRQSDILSVHFPSTILGSPLCPSESVKNLVSGLMLIFHLSNTFRMLAKVVSPSSVISDMSGGSLLIVPLYL